MRWAALLLAPVAAGALASPVAAPQPFAGEVLGKLGDGFEVTLNASWTPDGSEMLFSRAMKDWSRIQIRSAPVRKGQLGNPVPVAFADPGARDVDPFVSPDGKSLYFASDRPIPGDDGPRAYHLWKADRAGKGWGAARALTGEAATLGALLYPSVDRHGMLVFTRMTAEGPRLYTARMEGDAIRGAAPLALEGVTVALDSTVAREGDRIVFVAPVEAGSRARAIFLTRRVGGKWGTPRIVHRPEPAGTSVFATGLSRDGRTLYFSSNLPVPGSGNVSNLFSLRLPD